MDLSENAGIRALTCKKYGSKWFIHIGIQKVFCLQFVEIVSFDILKVLVQHEIGWFFSSVFNDKENIDNGNNK